MDTIEQLKQHMTKNNMTQHQVCRELNCQAASLSRWLLGKAKPSYAWDEMIKNYLKKVVDVN